MGSENTGPKDDNENVGSIEARHSVGKKGRCKPGPILNSWLFPCAETAAKTTNPAGIPASGRIADCMNGCALMKSPSDATVDFSRPVSNSLTNPKRQREISAVCLAGVSEAINQPTASVALRIESVGLSVV